MDAEISHYLRCRTRIYQVITIKYMLMISLIMITAVRAIVYLIAALIARYLYKDSGLTGLPFLRYFWSTAPRCDCCGLFLPVTSGRLIRQWSSKMFSKAEEQWGIVPRSKKASQTPGDNWDSWIDSDWPEWVDILPWPKFDREKRYCTEFPGGSYSRDHCHRPGVLFGYSQRVTIRWSCWSRFQCQLDRPPNLPD